MNPPPIGKPIETEPPRPAWVAGRLHLGDVAPGQSVDVPLPDHMAARLIADAQEVARVQRRLRRAWPWVLSCSIASLVLSVLAVGMQIGRLAGWL